ncbi:MAG TPA: VOC family protein [Candidatus Gemmiger faecavium]|nr:VOC family protein [Candidatus Gemmiger faecavium]
MDWNENVTGIQHVGIPTNDIEKTIRFYTSLGFEVALRTVNEAAGEAVCFLRLKNLCIETYQNGCAAGRPGAIDHIALDVTDVDAAFEKARAMGLQMLDDQVNFLPFWENGVRFFTVQGPNGEKVEFSQMM